MFVQQIVAQEEEEKVNVDAYFDVDALHALCAVESYVARYNAVSAIRWHGRVWVLVAKGKCDETIAPQENARWRSPARACSGGEDTFRRSRNGGIGWDGGGG